MPAKITYFMIKAIQELITSINYYFDKTHYVAKSERSLNWMDKTLIAKSKSYKASINKVQELYSTKRCKIIIDHPYYELVAVSIAAKGKKYSSFGTSYRLLPIHKYLRPTKELLRILGNIGETSSITNTSNIIGKCAEIKAINNIFKRESGISAADVSFTRAIRPRTLEKFPRCQNCTQIFGNEN
jgi:hypothetical protein